MNAEMNAWNPDKLPTNWEAMRNEWLDGHDRNFFFNIAFSVLVFLGCYFYWTPVWRDKTISYQMTTILNTARPIALYILILFTTGYAALGVFSLICPYEQHFDTITFAKYWQIVDGYMGKRMPIYGNTWLAVIFINLILFFKTRRQSPIFWIILASLLILIADMVFTGLAQLPINRYFQSVDINHLTTQQIKTLQTLREQMNSNFSLRGLGGWTMFFIMSITPFLLPRLTPQKA